jgi:hypothetical protein
MSVNHLGGNHQHAARGDHGQFGESCSSQTPNRKSKSVSRF